MNNLTRTIFMTTLVLMAALVPLPLGALEKPQMTGGDIIREWHGTGKSLDYNHGWAMAFAGDLNADGKGDVLVTARVPDRLIAYSGADGLALWTVDHSTLTGSALRSGFTGFVSGPVYPDKVRHCGDIDADGRDDVLVSGYAYGNIGTETYSNNTVACLSGTDGRVIWLWQIRHLYHAMHAILDICPVPDRNADGQADVAVLYMHGIEVISGRTGTLLWTRRFEVPANSGGVSALSGRVLESYADSNRDGVDEILVGSPVLNKVHVIDGLSGLILRSLSGERGYGHFGGAVKRVGDINGDSVPEFLVGASNETTYPFRSGKVYLYDGATETVLWSESDNRDVLDALGNSLARVGDLDADGTADFAVGSRSHYTGNPSANSSGCVRVYSGRTRQRIWRAGLDDDYVSIPGGGEFGGRIDSGDVNGDGALDLIVAAHTGAGRVFVFDLPGRRVESAASLTALLGGTLEVTSGDRSGVRLHIPPLTLTSDSVGHIRLGEPELGPAYDTLAGSGLKGSLVECLPSQTFAKSVTLTLPLEQEASSSEIIRVKYFNEASGQWVEVPGASVTADRLHVTVEVDHFTIFGAFGESVGVAAGSGSSSIGSSVAAALGSGGGGGGGCLISSTTSEGADITILAAALGLMMALSALLGREDKGTGVK